MRRGDSSTREPATGADAGAVSESATAWAQTIRAQNHDASSMSQETLTERGRAPRAGLGTLDVMASPEDRRLKEMIKSSLFGDLSAPVRIGRFTVTEQLGSGGMGVVYAARDEELDRKVAIKLLRSDQGDQGDQGDQARARLLREARAMARLSHPNVVTIHEVGSYDDQVFLAMEYLEGEDLAACLARERRLPWAEARALALQLCDALAAMHERGLVHRDIKPHNIFLVTPPGRSSTPRRPRVKVLDFGIAKLTRADASSVHSSSAAGGELVGTAAYIAPEQARAGAVDGRADIYAVGLVLYELLTGRVPFSAPTFMAVVSQHLSEPPPPPRAVAPDADIPDDVERLILRCLEKQPDDRYADVHELLAALRAIPEAPADPVAVAAAVAPRRPALLGALGAVLVLGL
ncbi:MAG: serine/threonine protein kinase, partial [Myxococcales bacterium]|nr:serine/threonine protein kinase [Myxococcales bacterium]